MTTHPDIRTELPPSIRGRFDSLGAYVNAVISGIEDARRTPRSRRLSLSVKQDIVLLVFIASLRQFLIEGSTAATAAANQVVSLEFAGFTVGTQFFAPDNENTRRGAVLAVALWSQIEDQRLKSLLTCELSISKLIEELYAVAKKPERLDRYLDTARRPN